MRLPENSAMPLSSRPYCSSRSFSVRTELSWSHHKLVAHLTSHAHHTTQGKFSTIAYSYSPTMVFSTHYSHSGTLLSASRPSTLSAYGRLRLHTYLRTDDTEHRIKIGEMSLLFLFLVPPANTPAPLCRFDDLKARPQMKF